MKKNKYPLKYRHCFAALEGSGLQGAVPAKIKELQCKIECLIYSSERKYYRFFKRLFDVAASTTIILLLSPVLIGVALGCAFTIRGSIFFTQIRIGQGGSFFWILKFRSLHLHHSKSGKGNTPFTKVDETVATNAFGRFIRNYKLDELAQLFNVLMGDMSLVGPRPFSVEDASFVPPAYDIRYYPKPGMTGLWRSRYSSLSSPRSKILMDCLYARKASFALDLDCLLRTAFVVVRGELRTRIYPDSRPFLRHAPSLGQPRIDLKKAS